MEKIGIKCKQLMTREVEERLKDNRNLFLTSFSNTVIPEQEILRHKLKEIDASLFVIKNRIAKRVFQKSNLEDLSSLMRGLTALAMGGRDVISISKALVDFGREHENFEILGAYVDEQLLDPASVKKLASIPSKEALLAQIIFGFKAPVQRLANSLSATIKKFISVIDKIREQKTEGR